MNVLEFPSLLIRKYKSKDAPKCLLAFKSNVPDFFAPAEIDLFGNWLQNLHMQSSNGKIFHHKHYYVMIINQEIVGCGGFGYNEQTKEVMLAWGLIDKQHHKKQLGEKLLIYRLREIRLMYPDTNVIIDTTQHTCSFFKKYGFAVEKITNDFYAPGMHRYDMRLNFNAFISK